jgi:hypothetical protein
MKLELSHDAEGKFRIAVYVGEDEPTWLPSAARAGTDIRPTVFAAVRAAPDAESDRDGLFWRKESSAKKALKAARSVRT